MGYSVVRHKSQKVMKSAQRILLACSSSRCLCCCSGLVDIAAVIGRHNQRYFWELLVGLQLQLNFCPLGFHKVYAAAGNLQLFRAGH